MNNQIDPHEEQLRNNHRQDVENFYQRLREGWEPEFIPDYFMYILKEDGLIKEDNLSDFFSNMLGKRIENIYKKQ